MLPQQLRGGRHQEGQSAPKVCESVNVIWRWCALFTRTCLEECFCWQENIVSMGGTSLRPHFPLRVSTLPLFPAAQGHVMVRERLMHLQQHAMKSN